jgi:hypothetical protein
MRLYPAAVLLLALAACGDDPIPMQTWNGTEWVSLTCGPLPAVTIDGVRYVGSICEAEK